MTNFEDFMAMNPNVFNKDFVNMHNAMHQDIMSSTFSEVDMLGFAPIDYSLNMGDIPPVIDIFGTPHFVDPIDVDIMSGLPLGSFTPINVSSSPSFAGSEPVQSYEQWKLDQGNEIEAMRDTAVQHYNEAKSRGDFEDMLKWESEANKQQGRLYDHWGTPTYGLPPKAPNIS